jgi:glycerol-3-phosphate dehydrogenase (NAD(P)+)
MKVSIIGLGNLGSAIAYIAAGNGHSVHCWEYDESVVDEVNKLHCNQRFLPGREFPATITATTVVADVLVDTELVFVTLPARFINPVLGAAAVVSPSEIPIVNMSKGLDAKTGETAYQLLSRMFADHPRVMLAGPSLANEFVDGVTTGLVAASESLEAIASVGSALNNTHMFVKGSNDPIGVELGGILKNIYALGMGIFTDAGMNFTGAYLTQSLLEMKTLGKALGAQPSTFDGLAGMGDLITTSLSEHSHNRTMGRLVAEGLSLEEVETRMGILPEGYHTLSMALSLASEHQVAMPVARLLNAVITGEQSVSSFQHDFVGLMRGQ